MIDKLIKTANEIEKYFNKNSFSKIAFKKLESLQISCDVLTLEDEISHLISQGKLPKQVNLYNEFGQPPITIFNNNKFAMDIYFWQDNDTSIHCHSFSGAFKLFSGYSLHEVYTVDRFEHDFEDIYFSKLNLKETNILSPGSTSEIQSGNNFIHRLVHLSNPTITLCLRTIDDVNNAQWQYFSSGVSIQKNNISQIELKNLFFLEYQYLQKRSNIQNKVIQFIENLSISKKLNLYEKIHLLLFGFTEQFNDFILNILEDIIQKNSYFKSYVKYYQETQDYIEFVDDTPEDRLITHCLNNMIESTILQDLFKNLTSRELNDFLSKYDQKLIK